MTDSIVRDYLESYQFVHDDGSSRALTDDERALLEDFGEGLMEAARIKAKPKLEAAFIGQSESGAETWTPALAARKQKRRKA